MADAIMPESEGGKYRHVWAVLRNNIADVFDLAEQWRNAEATELLDRIMDYAQAAMTPRLDDVVIALAVDYVRSRDAAKETPHGE